MLVLINKGKRKKDNLMRSPSSSASSLEQAMNILHCLLRVSEKMLNVLPQGVVHYSPCDGQHTQNHQEKMATSAKADCKMSKNPKPSKDHQHSSLEL